MYSWIEFGHDFANYWIGVGDDATLGGTKILRNWLWGPDCYTDTDSWAYEFGEWTGLIASSFIGLGGGARIAGARAARYAELGSAKSGLEFSHWVPTRYFKKFGLGKYDKRSIWNGNYVPIKRHIQHDPFRFGEKGVKKYSYLYRQYSRIPLPYKGLMIGMAWGSGGMIINNYLGDGCDL